MPFSRLGTKPHSGNEWGETYEKDLRDKRIFFEGLKFFENIFLFSCDIVRKVQMLGYCIRVWVIVENNLRYNIASKFVWSNSIARAVLHIPILHTHDVSKQIPREKFSFGLKCYKTIGSYVSCAFIEIWSTWEVWRALKKLDWCCIDAVSRNSVLVPHGSLRVKPIFGFS